IVDYALELPNTGGTNDQFGSPTFTRVNNLYETNSGYTHGHITFSSTQAGATITAGAVANGIWTHGGQGFITECVNGINNIWSQYTTANAAKTRLTSYYGDSGGNLAYWSNNAPFVVGAGWE